MTVSGGFHDTRRTVIILFFLLAFTFEGCSAEPRDERQTLTGITGIDLVTGGLTYIFKAPHAMVSEELESVFQEKFTNPHVDRNLRKTHAPNYEIFIQITSDFNYYKKNGKKYREKCEAWVYIIGAYPDYSEVDVSCDRDVYELGLITGRGGIHNLFTQWWDWYPDSGLYVSEDILELITKKIHISDSEVIKLNKKNSYDMKEILQSISVNEKQNNDKDGR